jgi:hypothetical protein
LKKVQYSLNCDLKISPNSFVRVADELEISLPCINCQRNRRTILFKGINQKGVCTPKSKCRGFPGSIVLREVIKDTNSIKINYLIEFDYHPFIDLKYNIESNFKSSWARVYFTLKCSQCLEENIVSTQQNLHRPTNKYCKCGNILFKDKKVPFKYNSIEIS